MGLAIGIVGLPNVGKSTLFNALTREQNAQSANYPFCTIEPNHAVVPVPDERLENLARIVEPEKVIHATVEFVDIAGLVRGASQGEGLGNQFLANIREAAAILHVVRCFEDDDITHVDGSVDPVRDVETIETELLLADVQTIEKTVDRLTRKAKGDPEARAALAAAKGLAAHLDEGRPASSFAETSDAAGALIVELGLLTAKPVIYCANVDETGLAGSTPLIDALQGKADQENRQLVRISAGIEEEMAGLKDAERAEFLSSYGVTTGGVEQVIQAGYRTLGLCSYFTAGPKEARAWTFHAGWTAPKAASVIHTDFERGFIRAEVMSYDDYVRLGGEAGCKNAGLLRVEGKEYVVQDGDVMHFRFNV